MQSFKNYVPINIPVSDIFRKTPEYPAFNERAQPFYEFISRPSKGQGLRGEIFFVDESKFNSEAPEFGFIEMNSTSSRRSSSKDDECEASTSAHYKRQLAKKFME
mmetsp:Transcript_29356/g.44276  ORF Transcript_29356/g.44276 Transcript_29356/m.44276 type:complete len:105 (-) Transcript_29356:5113-5427(-)